MSSTAIRRAAPANPVNASVATAQIFALASAPTIPVTVAIPGAGALDGRRFMVRAEGNVYISTAAYTAKVGLYAALTIPATPFTPGNWTLLGAGTARAAAAPGYFPWWIEAELMYDSAGGLMQGTFSQMVNNLFDARAAIANQLTGINGTNVTVTQGSTPVPPANPVAVIAAAITFGTANAANVGNLVNFEVSF